MKDYSLNLEGRKDFILGYDITSEGMIRIKYAKGKPWFVPYNEENENIILGQMKKQLSNSDVYEKKFIDKIKKSVSLSVIIFLFALICLFSAGDTIFLYYLAIAYVGASLISGVFAIKNKLKLNDLRKNIKFLEIEEKLNEAVKKEQNTLVDVSKRTKNVIKDFPEDRHRPVFNINSFNYVPFKDLEQIMENVERNEKFGFDYTKQEEPDKGIIRKKIR